MLQKREDLFEFSADLIKKLFVFRVGPSLAIKILFVKLSNLQLGGSCENRYNCSTGARTNTDLKKEMLFNGIYENYGDILYQVENFKMRYNGPQAVETELLYMLDDNKYAYYIEMEKHRVPAKFQELISSNKA